ncbi:hypothetical protein EZMO1_2808 [Endozoicomonas montiporae CL-33]|nr:hypothetical protein EZMO1_2808 [Endozoicomonas montiporae CL-33]
MFNQAVAGKVGFQTNLPVTRYCAQVEFWSLLVKESKNETGLKGFTGFSVLSYLYAT